MTIENDDIIEIFLGSYGAEPVEGRRPLMVNFTGDPEYDEIVEDETGIYEIIETDNSTAEICELEH